MDIHSKQRKYSKSILSVLKTNESIEQPINEENNYSRSTMVPLIFIFYSLWAIPFFFILVLNYHFHSAVFIEDFSYSFRRRTSNLFDLNLFSIEISREFDRLKWNCLFCSAIYSSILILSVLHLKMFSTYRDRK